MGNLQLLKLSSLIGMGGGGWGPLAPTVRAYGEQGTFFSCRFPSEEPLPFPFSEARKHLMAVPCFPQSPPWAAGLQLHPCMCWMQVGWDAAAMCGCSASITVPRSGCPHLPADQQQHLPFGVKRSAQVVVLQRKETGLCTLGEGKGWGLCCPFCCTGTHFMLCAGRRAAPPALLQLLCAPLSGPGASSMGLGALRQPAALGINPKRGRKSPLHVLPLDLLVPPLPPPPLALYAMPEQLWAPRAVSPSHLHHSELTRPLPSHNPTQHLDGQCQLHPTPLPRVAQPRASTALGGGSG